MIFIGDTCAEDPSRCAPDIWRQSSGWRAGYHPKVGRYPGTARDVGHSSLGPLPDQNRPFAADSEQVKAIKVPDTAHQNRIWWA
ncbi:hypothetical protein RHA1_ro08929 (plasmid) [Rhodococcus jostii RHA1]|uniref:Uncharacterized protein n=1 Tax=Rhodococcus jostii (strain RHA1) TaxID=101510 RepID=Q0RXL3_RHOJR|nr:hypothetical protein RHA1_ro08929 [Rhodococcus jostii RHA1]